MVRHNTPNGQKCCAHRSPFKSPVHKGYNFPCSTIFTPLARRRVRRRCRRMCVPNGRLGKMHHPAATGHAQQVSFAGFRRRRGDLRHFPSAFLHRGVHHIVRGGTLALEPRLAEGQLARGGPHGLVAELHGAGPSRPRHDRPVVAGGCLVGDHSVALATGPQALPPVQRPHLHHRLIGALRLGHPFQELVVHFEHVKSDKRGAHAAAGCPSRGLHCGPWTPEDEEDQQRPFRAGPCLALDAEAERCIMHSEWVAGVWWRSCVGQ